MRPLLVLCAIALMLPVDARGGEELAQTLVLPGGEVIQGRVIQARGPHLVVRIGTERYELESAGVRIERSRSTPDADATDLHGEALVGDLVPWLDHADAELRGAARAGLGALGVRALPHLEAARRATHSAGVRDALDEILAELEAGIR